MHKIDRKFGVLEIEEAQRQPLTPAVRCLEPVEDFRMFADLPVGASRTRGRGPGLCAGWPS
jgi:hypothetical protein